MTTVGPLQPDTNLIEIYQLRYVDPETACSALRTILAGDNKGFLARDNEAFRINIDAKNKRLIVFGPPATHSKVRNVLKTLDVSPGMEDGSIKVFHLRYVDPSSAARMLAAILPKGIQVAIDERTHSLITSGSPDSLHVAEALLTRLDEGTEKERPKPSLRYEVRVVWLANDDKADQPAEDLKDVVAELSRLGIKNPRQIGQMAVRNTSMGPFQIESSPMFKGEAAKFTATGTLREERDGPLTLQIAIKTTGGLSGQSQDLNKLDMQIDVPQKQYVVLATTPVGNITSAFVVQVVGSAKPTELK